MVTDLGPQPKALGSPTMAYGLRIPLQSSPSCSMGHDFLGPAIHRSGQLDLPMGRIGGRLDTGQGSRPQGLEGSNLKGLEGLYYHLTRRISNSRLRIRPISLIRAGESDIPLL